MKLTITIDLDNDIFNRDEEELQRLLTSIGERYPYPFEPITMEIHAANEQHVGQAIMGDDPDADLLLACKRAVPWMGKLIAEGVHERAVMPHDAVRTLQMLEAAIAARS
jgi:hypothetical protein